MAGLAEAVERFGAAHRLPADILNALQVAVDEQGLLLLAGFLIQRNADRVSSMRRGDRVVLEFNFQHRGPAGSE